MSMKTLLLQPHPHCTVASIELARILDGLTIQLLGEELTQAAAESNYQLIVDFAAVEFTSSAVLGKLVMLRKLIKAQGGRLVLCNVGKSMTEALRITGLRILFDVVDDVTQAVEFMRVNHVSWREDVK